MNEQSHELQQFLAGRVRDRGSVFVLERTLHWRVDDEEGYTADRVTGRVEMISGCCTWQEELQLYRNLRKELEDFCGEGSLIRSELHQCSFTTERNWMEFEFLLI